MAEATQITEATLASAKSAAGNLFLADPTIVPGAGIYAQTTGTDKTPQSEQELVLEVQRNIAMLSELANTTTDPEAKAELNAAITQLASIQGSPNARAAMAEVMRGAQGVIAYVQSGASGGYSASSASGAKMAIASGRMPTAYDIQNSRYVTSDGYVRDDSVDAFLRDFGFSEQTRAAVAHANSLMAGTNLHNDASILAAQATIGDTLPGFNDALRGASSDADVVTISTNGMAIAFNVGTLRDNPDDLQKWRDRALATNNYAALDLISRMQTIVDDPSVPDDAAIPLGHFANAARDQGLDYDAIASAHARDIDSRQDYLERAFSGDARGEYLEIAREYGIDVDSMPPGEAMDALVTMAGEDPRIQTLKFARDMGDNADAFTAAIMNMSAEERTTFAAMSVEEKAEALRASGIAYTEEQLGTIQRTILPIVNNPIILEEVVAARQADIHSIEAGELPTAMSSMMMNYTVAGLSNGRYQTYGEMTEALGSGAASLTVAAMNYVAQGGANVQEAIVSWAISAEPKTQREATGIVSILSSEIDSLESRFGSGQDDESLDEAQREEANRSAELLAELRRRQLNLTGRISPLAMPDDLLEGGVDFGADVLSEGELAEVRAADAIRLQELAEERLSSYDPLIEQFRADPGRFVNAAPGSPDAELYVEMEDALYYLYTDEAVASGNFPGALAHEEAERRIAEDRQNALAQPDAIAVQETEEERRIREAYAEYATSRTEAAASPVADTAAPPSATVSPDAANPAPTSTPAASGLPPEAAAAAAAAAAPVASAGCSSAGVEGTDALTAPPPPSPSAAPPPLAVSGVGPS